MGSTAVAPQSAGTAPATPSTPSPGGTGGDGGAILTDDAILGIPGDAPSSPAAEPQSAPPAAAPAATPTPTTVPDELSLDDFKALFQANPKVNSLWDRYNNYNDVIQQFGTVADARKVAELVSSLGGTKDFDSIISKAADVDQTDAAFFSGTPDERKALINEWYNGEGQHEFGVTSQAVFDNVKYAMDIMGERDPNRLAELRGDIVLDALSQHGYGQLVSAIVAAYPDIKSMPDAVKQLVSWSQQYGLVGDRRQQSPEARAVEERAAALDRQQSEFVQNQVQARIEEGDKIIGAEVSSTIDKMLSALKVNGRAVFGTNSTMIKRVIAEKINSALIAALGKNPAYLAQINSAKARGLNVTAKEMADIAIRHAKVALNSVATPIIEEWTKGVVGGAAATAARAQAGASRPDVGSGSASGPSSRTKPLTQAEANKMSVDDILNA